MIDPIELQVISGALRSACEEMGATLVRAAHSPNIKERKDCSTALFDANGEMVMQAEHIPVHLGSMPDALAAVREQPQVAGRSWILNDPFSGGTHLPDITVITPVFAEASDRRDDAVEAAGKATAFEQGDKATAFEQGDKETAFEQGGAATAFERGDKEAAFGQGGTATLIGFAVCRAHHADVGGDFPGSMPADSTRLEEEGVIIAPQPILEGTLQRLTLRMRNRHERSADLRAQLAANRVGVLRMRELAATLGVRRLREANDEVLAYAERRMAACIAALKDGVFRASDVLEGREGDLPLELEATVAGDKVTLSFAGSAPEHEGNLNCPFAVTKSACMFAMKVLSDPDIPPSTGAFRPIEVQAPLGCLLNARRPAAVAAGNVETSSRVADLVMCAFGMALGQGTMNNLTFGTGKRRPSVEAGERATAAAEKSPPPRARGFTYYETIGGGQGACADADGPSAVHVAMSNTLNTPIEAMERELPLRVTAYRIRRGSGGAGLRRGGEGVIREIEALEEMSFSLITERRRHSPKGASGGEPGARGRNLLIPADEGGQARELPAKVSGTLRAGERLRIETPGGGGYGTRRD